jgi:hypothetical protein
MMVKMLQTTTTTSGEMLASWVHPVLRRRDNLGDATFIIVALLIVTAKLHRFTGKRTINKAGFSGRTAHAATIVNKVDNIAG